MIEVLAIALAVIAVAAGVALIALVVQRDEARAERDLAKQQREKEYDRAVSVEKQLASDTARLESIIDARTRDIAQLEEDLDACNDPSVVRDRLRRMLQGPIRPGRATDPQGVPPKPAAG